MIEVRLLETSADIAAEAARLAASDLEKALKAQQVATFVLAGGRLPPLASGVLAEKYADAFDWKRILFLIGDERCVPLDDPDSSWLSVLPVFAARPEITPAHMLRPQSQLPAEAAAKAYSETLLALPVGSRGIPILNHLWLGIGEDGHTLSLFPGHPSLDLARETDQLVIPVHNSPKPPADRISLSLKALEGVGTGVVFISGADKAPILARIAAGDHSLPAVVASKTIEKAGGRVIWLVDKEAASQLPAGQAMAL